MKDISIITPIYNEEENIPILVQKVHQTMESVPKSYEFILIDDGSTDKSVQVIKGLRGKYPQIRLICFRRNFGQTAAMSAGFDLAEGNIIVTIDADLQNDPSDIPMFIAKIEEGYDLVNGWRKDRKDSFIRKIPSLFANAVISFVTRIHLRDYGCTLKAYKKEVAKDLKLYGEMHRFIPALASWSGVSLVEVPVKHHPRTKGKSKYGIARTFRVILDLFTVKFLLSYATSPIQIFGAFGIAASLIGIVTFCFAIFLKITEGLTLTGNPLFYLFIFLETLFIQLIFIGLLAEINVRMYHEFQQKKIYVIDQNK